MKTILLFVIALFIISIASAQVEQVTMQRSNPMTIQVDCQDYMFEVSPGSVLLGIVEPGVEDSFNRDYSALAGSSEFKMNFDNNIISFGNTAPVSKPARIGILELKESPGEILQVRVDGGKTSLCFPIGTMDIPAEELSKLVRLIRTKDNRLAAIVTFNDREGVFASLQPGIRERICMVVPLLDADPSKSLKFAKDREGITYALLLVHDGSKRIKSEISGKASLKVTVLTPTDKAVAEKMGLTLVVMN
jgi:hypothetical protein